MWKTWRILATTTFLLGWVAPAAIAQPAPEQGERNREAPEKARRDSEDDERLRRELEEFRKLPPEQQARLRQLDRMLHEKGAAADPRLQRVFQRYVRWLEHLPEADRKRIEAASDPRERLRIIRGIREREWLERLPKAVREELQQLKGKERAARIHKLREEQQKRGQEWQRALQRKPTRLSELPPDMQQAVTEKLLPLLTQEETDRLKTAEGQPQYARVLLELIRKHKLPGAPPFAKPAGDRNKDPQPVKP